MEFPVSESTVRDVHNALCMYAVTLTDDSTEDKQWFVVDVILR